MTPTTEKTQIMNDAAIELRGIVKSYGTKHVLTGLDLSVPKGSVLGLLGTNGAGKTTLIKCALGLIRPQQGEARLLGENSWTLRPRGKNTHWLCAAGGQSVSVDEGAALDRLHGCILPQLEPRIGCQTYKGMGHST